MDRYATKCYNYLASQDKQTHEGRQDANLHEWLR